MKKFLVLFGTLICFGLSSILMAEPDQEDILLINLSSNGNDARTVLSQLFKQAKLNFIFEPKQPHPLYLELNDIEFEEALALICTACNYKYNFQNGIFHIKNTSAQNPGNNSSGKNVSTPAQGKLPNSVLSKNISVDLKKTSLSQVFLELGKQADVPIEVHKNIPPYKIDAVFQKKSLGHALGLLTRKTGLKFEFTNRNSLLISKDTKARS